VPVAELSESQLTYLTEVDHHDHEALVAFTEDGELVGVARFVRVADEPDAAEAAVTVGDDWQGRGLGTALTQELARRAQEEDVEVFTATALASNAEVIDLLSRLGRTEVRPGGSGSVEMRIVLADGVGRGTPLLEALKHHAKGLLTRR
jgi:RimJ/RimL family protein N-acetyltransferase